MRTYVAATAGCAAQVYACTCPTGADPVTGAGARSLERSDGSTVAATNYRSINSKGFRKFDKPWENDFL